MAAATLQPAAGAAGELTGLLLMRAWHEAQGETRHKVIIPDSAHGTNPASVTLGGYEVVTVPSDDRGLRRPGRAARRCSTTDVAGIMLTNPNTLGLFEEDIAAIAAAVHEVGGLLYYDGANLNAILGVVRPGDMGFDIVHLNLHKTFATPHGGGGPGAGPVAVSERLVPFLPGPRPTRLADGAGTRYGWTTTPSSRSAGSTPGTATRWCWPGPSPTCWSTAATGCAQVAELAVLNANWLRQRLSATYDVPFDRPCMHECVLSAASLKQATGVRALDVAKRLLEEGFHSPTVYFPLIVDEALMIEPTETESLQTLEALATALETDRRRGAAPGGAEKAAGAPHGTPGAPGRRGARGADPRPHLRRPALTRSTPVSRRHAHRRRMGEPK